MRAAYLSEWRCAWRASPAADSCCWTSPRWTWACPSRRPWRCGARPSAWNETAITQREQSRAQEPACLLLNGIALGVIFFGLSGSSLLDSAPVRLWSSALLNRGGEHSQPCYSRSSRNAVKNDLLDVIYHKIETVSFSVVLAIVFIVSLPLSVFCTQRFLFIAPLYSAVV